MRRRAFRKNNAVEREIALRRGKTAALFQGERNVRRKTRDGAFLCELARAVSAEVGEKAKGEKKMDKKKKMVFTRN